MISLSWSGLNWRFFRDQHWRKFLISRACWTKLNFLKHKHFPVKKWKNIGALAKPLAYFPEVNKHKTLSQHWYFSESSLYKRGNSKSEPKSKTMACVHVSNFLSLEDPSVRFFSISSKWSFSCSNVKYFITSIEPTIETPSHACCVIRWESLICCSQVFLFFSLQNIVKSNSQCLGRCLILM